ncbi:unnamed protein product [Paramecium primaurelia]|uniref:Uncharacterized protein n=1 Tax=Paramecium primaurelia TaxID=5886 RepID=A0A8S1PF02_PARPR|nr:unnamed protein product [Paramecium primaurelia]
MIMLIQQLFLFMGDFTKLSKNKIKSDTVYQLMMILEFQKLLILQINKMKIQFQNQQKKGSMFILQFNRDDPSYYYKFIIQIKIFKDAPYFILQHYLTSNVSDWMYHTMKVIEIEVQSRPPIDWKQLKDEPLEKQIEGYIRHNKRVNIGQLLKKFNCSLQQLKVLIDQLKKRSAIAECLNKETFRIVN